MERTRGASGHCVLSVEKGAAKSGLIIGLARICFRGEMNRYAVYRKVSNECAHIDAFVAVKVTSKISGILSVPGMRSRQRDVNSLTCLKVIRYTGIDDIVTGIGQQPIPNPV